MVVVWRIGMAALLVLSMSRAGAQEVAAYGSNGANGSHNGNYDATWSGATGYPVIEIWKTARKMQMRQGGTLLGEYRVSLGQNPQAGKQVQGDGRTPVGRYFISDKNPGSRFHRFLGISYPNAEDADRGYRAGLLDAGQWADIFLANLRGEAPPSYTSLGGRVGIHGFGGRPYVPVDWTEGCIAVSDQEIEYIFENAPIGTLVVINE
jgi:hypothetical protein